MIRAASILSWTALTAGVLPACRPTEVGGGVAEIAITPPVEAIDVVFPAVDTTILRPSPEHPIIRVSGLAVSSDGRIAIGDVSEGDVKVYGPDGTPVFVAGRKGAGPGEFQQPRFPRFDREGRLHVADASNARVSIYDAEGKYQREVPLAASLMPVSGFAVLDDGRYLVASAGSSDRVLQLLGPEGDIEASYLERAAMRPVDQPQHRLWRTASQFWLAARGDSAFVVHTLNDSLWIVDLGTGATSSLGLTLPGYQPPMIPQTPPADMPALLAWTRSYHVAATILATDRAIVIPFVQGVLNFGDPSIVAVHRGGRWQALLDAAPMVAGGSAGVVALLDPDSEATDSLALGIYRDAAP